MGKIKIVRKDLKHDGLVDTVSITALYLQKYRRLYFSLGALLVVGMIIGGAFVYQKTRQRERVERLLGQARSLLALEEIYKKYPNTKSAPLALILAADILYQDGNYPEAQRKYRFFIEKYSTHELASFAQMGIAYSRESQENWEEAISGYQRLKEKFPESFLVTEAIFNIARCLIQLGRVDDAISAYSEIMSLYPRSVYGRLAGEQLIILESRTEGT